MKILRKAILTLLLLIILLPTPIDAKNNKDKSNNNKSPKYVFLFIGDGMGWSTVSVTESYLSYKEGELGGSRLCFTKFPVYGTAWTHSANKRVTDSAASGTTLATGIKTNNKRLGTDPEGKAVSNISEILHKKGYNIGIMTNVPLNHATPGAFYAHVKNRREYINVTMQLPKSNFEFFAGDGFIKTFEMHGDCADCYEYLEKHGYTVSYGVEEYNAKYQDGKKMVFVQERRKGKNSPTFTELTDINKNYVIEPDSLTVSLGTMMNLCLNQFTDQKPFFIMCEGGTIDWAAHEQKTIKTIEAVMDMDSAVQVAYDFYLQHPEETLIIVTADHDTGTPNIGWDGACNWEEIEKLEFDDEYIENFKKANRKINEKIGIRWADDNHMGNMVPVFAIGKGAENFAGGLDNTDIVKRILGLKK